VFICRITRTNSYPNNALETATPCLTFFRTSSCNTPLYEAFRNLLRTCLPYLASVSCWLSKRTLSFLLIWYVRTTVVLHRILIRIFVNLYNFIIFMLLFRTLVFMQRYDIHILWTDFCTSTPKFLIPTIFKF